MTNPTHRTVEPRRTTDETDAALDAAAADTAPSRRGSRSTAPETVPAGGRGADSGSADAVEIEPGDTEEIPDRSWGNDAPGVGTRGPGDSGEVETPSEDSYAERADDAPLPDLHDEREDSRVERSLHRRLRRDVGPDAAARDAADPHTQSRPKMAQHVATVEQEMWGLLVQTRTDMPRADRRRLREVFQERLCQAGIDLPADEVDRFLRLRLADRDEH